MGEKKWVNPFVFVDLVDLPLEGIDMIDAVSRLEIRLVVQALKRCNGNQTDAAKLLRISRDKLRHRVAKYDLDGHTVANKAPAEKHIPGLDDWK